ncbi:Disease resistance protein RPM1 [Spatholobus suberectus]|nr:Disease resistance protein RPM1 [Spatholobus suberectus]
MAKRVGPGGPTRQPTTKMAGWVTDLNPPARLTRLTQPVNPAGHWRGRAGGAGHKTHLTINRRANSPPPDFGGLAARPAKVARAGLLCQPYEKSYNRNTTARSWFRVSHYNTHRSTHPRQRKAAVSSEEVAIQVALSKSRMNAKVLSVVDIDERGVLRNADTGGAWLRRSFRKVGFPEQRNLKCQFGTKQLPARNEERQSSALLGDTTVTSRSRAEKKKGKNMAETAVTLLVEHLLKLLHEEATILGGVHNEVSGIRSQLNVIKSYIKDAEEKQEDVESVKEWVNELRKVAFRMEDVVDQYLLKVADRGQRHGVYRKVTEVKGMLKTRHDISSEIKEIRETIDRLYREREGLGLRSPAGESSATDNPATPRLGAHFVEESQLVGIDRNKRELTEWLTERQSSVMVVVGPGGIGKTAIVKNVYDKQEQVSQQKEKINTKGIGCFEFCAWLSISRPQVDDHNMLIRQIIQNILEKDPGASAALQSETTNLESLIRKVKEYFTDKRHLIVFDDVQEIKFWEVIKHAIIPNSSKSSKVIITTRDENVANFIGKDAFVEVRKVEPLSLDDGLKLFRQKAFQFEQVPDDPELNDLCKKFVMKCNRVPLAIVTIAGLLSTKRKTTTEWQKVLDQLGSLLQSNSLLDIVNQVMLESYHDLPSHLKPCFLYFGLFPEGYSISCMRLIRLWVAEGFVKESDSDDTSMEEFAKDQYLPELVRRCLVHVSRVDFDGRPKSCHVYDLMHKLITRICEEQMFCQVMKDKTTPPNSKLDSVPRRLSIIKKNDNATMERAEKWEKVRSCFVFDDAKKWLVTKKLFSSFGLLVRLDLSNARLDNLPKQVGNLLNLKYLSLRNTNIVSLPESIGNLEYLQTLDIKHTQVHKLPMEIHKLTKLRHLLAYFINIQYFGLDRLEGVKVNEGLQNLVSLQKLSFLDAGNGSIIEELKQLSKLRKLGIIKVKEEYGDALCKAIENMTHLCSLSIGAVGNDGKLQLQSLSNPPSFLQRLYLYGRLERLPNWIPKLPNLIRLYLKWSNLKEDPLPYIKDLSELLYLELYDTYGGDELHFKNGWLKGLKVLYLESLPKLKTIKIDKGAIPHLAELKIGKCHEMMQVPRDMKNLTRLQKLYLYDMHGEFMKRMRDSQSEDWRIINRIPIVEYSNDDHFATLHNLDS